MTTSYPLSTFEQHVYNKGDKKAHIQNVRSSMVSPPPPYHSVVNEKNASADQMIHRMNRVVHDTQTMMNELSAILTSLEASKISLDEQIVQNIPEDKNDIDLNESLCRIGDRLQQLIDEAQTSLRTHFAVRDPIVHRSISSPQLTTLYNVPTRSVSANTTPKHSDDDRDETDTEEIAWVLTKKKYSKAQKSTSFDAWRQRNERYIQSETRLDVAMGRLIETFQRIPRQDIGKPPRPAPKKTRPRQIHHHLHHHYHVHNEPPQSASSLSHLISYAVSSVRSYIPSKFTVQAEPPFLPSQPSQATTQPCTPQPPLRKLRQPLLSKSMFFATLLLFQAFRAFHHRNKSIWQLGIFSPSAQARLQKRKAARQLIPIFAASSQKLPISTWLQQATFLVYIARFIRLSTIM